MDNEENMDSFDRLFQEIDEIKSIMDSQQQQMDSQQRYIETIWEHYNISFIDELESAGKLVAFEARVEERIFWHDADVRRDLESLQRFRGTNNSNLRMKWVSSGFKYTYGHHAADIEPYLHKAPMEVINSLDRRGYMIRVEPDISNKNFKPTVNLCDEIVDLCARVDKDIKEKYQQLVETKTDS